MMDERHPIGSSFESIKNAAASDYVGGDVADVLMGADGEMRLMTRPVVVTEKMPSLGSVGDICLVDLSQYCVALRRDVRIEKSQHYGFNQDVSHYRAVLRVDGQAKWSAAMAPRNGDSTLSWCVTLAERS